MKLRLILYLASSLIAISIVVALGYVFSNIVAYIIISIILATILRPFVEKLSGIQIYNIRIPRFISILLAFSVFLGFLYSFIRLFVPLISNEVGLLSELNNDLLLEQANKSLSGIEAFLLEYGLVNEETGFIINNSRTYFIDFLHDLDFSMLINNAFSILGSVLVTVLAVTFMTFFFLLEKGILRKLFLRIIPNS